MNGQVSRGMNGWPCYRQLCLEVVGFSEHERQVFVRKKSRLKPQRRFLKEVEKTQLNSGVLSSWYAMRKEKLWISTRVFLGVAKYWFQVSSSTKNVNRDREYWQKSGQNYLYGTNKKMLLNGEVIHQEFHDRELAVIDSP